MSKSKSAASEAGSALARAKWAKQTPEQRRAKMLTLAKQRAAKLGPERIAEIAAIACLAAAKARKKRKKAEKLAGRKSNSHNGLADSGEKT